MRRAALLLMFVLAAVAGPAVAFGFTDGVYHHPPPTTTTSTTQTETTVTESTPTVTTPTESTPTTTAPTGEGPCPDGGPHNAGHDGAPGNDDCDRTCPATASACVTTPTITAAPAAVTTTAELTQTATTPAPVEDIGTAAVATTPAKTEPAKQSTASGVRGAVTKPKPKPAELPFTGLDLRLMLCAAAVLIGSGLLLRRRGRS